MIAHPNFFMKVQRSRVNNAGLIGTLRGRDPCGGSGTATQFSPARIGWGAVSGAFRSSRGIHSWIGRSGGATANTCAVRLGVSLTMIPRPGGRNHIERPRHDCRDRFRMAGESSIPAARALRTTRTPVDRPEKRLRRCSWTL